MNPLLFKFTLATKIEVLPDRSPDQDIKLQCSKNCFVHVRLCLCSNLYLLKTLTKKKDAEKCFTRKPINKKISWVHSAVSKRRFHWSSMKWLLIFQVNAWQVLTETLNPTSPAYSMPQFSTPPLITSHNSKLLWLYRFQNAVKPKTEHNCGWQNSALDWEEGKRKSWDNPQTYFAFSTQVGTGHSAVPGRDLCTQPHFTHSRHMFWVAITCWANLHSLPAKHWKVSTRGRLTCPPFLVQPLVNYYVFINLLHNNALKVTILAHVTRTVQSNTGLMSGLFPKRNMFKGTWYHYFSLCNIFFRQFQIASVRKHYLVYVPLKRLICSTPDDSLTHMLKSTWRWLTPSTRIITWDIKSPHLFQSW